MKSDTRPAEDNLEEPPAKRGKTVKEIKTKRIKEVAKESSKMCDIYSRHSILVNLMQCNETELMLPGPHQWRNNFKSILIVSHL
jgi:hypothetical protein